MSLPGVLDPWREVIHPAALILPRPSETEYNDLKHSIETRGVLTPLATYIDAKGEHWLLDGVSRLQVLVELDKPILDAEGRWAIPTTPYSEEQGHDPYEIALSLNVIRRHLTNEQKREVINQLRSERPELSDRAIARMAGVDPKTVAHARHGQEEAEVEHDPETGEIIEEQEPETGDSQETATITPIRRARERREESGRRTRGRQPESPRQRLRRRQETREAQTVVDGPQPFIGTILPNASKTARVAEARRCLKHLGLTVADLGPRRRGG